MSFGKGRRRSFPGFGRKGGRQRNEEADKRNLKKIYSLLRMWYDDSREGRGGGSMPSNIEQLLHLYRRQLESVLNGHMKRMILYGFYARGDFKQDSDIDVMILLDLDGSALRSCEKKICDVTYDFNYWKKAYMFYHNVDTEGIEI